MRAKFVSSVLFILSLIFAPAVLAQLQTGQVELSLAASYIEIRESDGDVTNFLWIPIRYGLFLNRNLEIEPEVILSSSNGSDGGALISANALYHLPFSVGSKDFPFFLAGVGFANESHLHNLMNYDSGNEHYNILNLGFGSKIFLNNSVALRLEYRFQRFFADKYTIDLGPGQMYTFDPSLNLNNVLLGFSFYLK